MRGRFTLNARGPAGTPICVAGQTARALLALVEAGARGLTALEAGTWALRLAAYVHDLRHKHGLVIAIDREAHEGGWHGRYRLCSPVELVEASQW